MSVIAKSITANIYDPSSTIDARPLQRKIRVLLVKPYQPSQAAAESPPLGLLCLSASLRQTFGDSVEVKVVDMKLYRQGPADIAAELALFDADALGISALNCEAQASREIAAFAKKVKPGILTILGGPHAHKRGEEILACSEFDWVIGGPGDRVLPQALRRFFNKDPLGTDILGLSYKTEDGKIVATTTQDLIQNLDELPLPDWHFIDFDTYSKRMTMMAMQKGKRYALLFTSRGCPYLCNYCHDIFSKSFKFQSAERVIKEIETLYEQHGVTEFQIVDDIFNLHKPRVKKIMHEVHRRWPGKIHFAFPNAVRADILDEDVLDDLKLGGTYALGISVETATPRLQKLIDKHLDTDKTHRMIEEANKRGIMVAGFFMLGFPTETPEEMEATVQYALSSKLSNACFFSVIPQPGTPIYPIAEKENAAALKQSVANDEAGKLGYHGFIGAPSWYELAYGFPLSDYSNRVMMRFYFTPSRMWRLIRRMPTLSLIKTVYAYIVVMMQRQWYKMTR